MLKGKMLLSFTDILIIMTRLFLETVSYYNAKAMYALKGYERLSPLLVLYLTHSLGTVLFLRDIVVYRTSYIKKVVNDTKIPFIFMISSVAFLSLFYNLCHIPKFYAMNYVSDVSIVSIYGCSVIFTYIFAVLLINAKVDSVGVFSVALGVLGMVFLVWNDSSMGSHFYLVMSVCISSILSGMYGVFFKMVMCHKIEDKRKECLNCLENDKLPYTENDGKLDKIEQECKECIQKYNQSIDKNPNNQGVNTSTTEKEGVSSTSGTNHKQQNTKKFVGIGTKFDGNQPSSTQNSDNEKSTSSLCQSHQKEKLFKAQSQNKQSIHYNLPNSIYTFPLKGNTKKSTDEDSTSLKSSDIELQAKNADLEINFKTKEDKQIYFLKYPISVETYRRLMFMRHYMSLTGLITFLFYWPGLYFVNVTGCEEICLPKSLRPFFHVFVANIFSLLHNLIYFVIVAVKTPLFAQISGIIMQPTFLFINIVENRGISCITELTGCVLSFTAFLMLCNRH